MHSAAYLRHVRRSAKRIAALASARFGSPARLTAFSLCALALFAAAAFALGGEVAQVDLSPSAIGRSGQAYSGPFKCASGLLPKSKERISLRLWASGGGQKGMLFLEDVRFFLKGRELHAELNAEVNPWPECAWNIEIELHDGQDTLLARSSHTIRNSGLIVTEPMWTSVKHDFVIGPRELAEGAQWFRVAIVEKAPAEGAAPDEGNGGLATPPSGPPEPAPQEVQKDKAGNSRLVRFQGVFRMNQPIDVNLPCPGVPDPWGNEQHPITVKQVAFRDIDAHLHCIVVITGATSADGEFAIRVNVLTTEGGGEFTFETEAEIADIAFAVSRQRDLDLGPIAQFADATHFEVEIEDVTQRTVPAPDGTPEPTSQEIHKRKTASTKSARFLGVFKMNQPIEVDLPCPGVPDPWGNEQHPITVKQVEFREIDAHLHCIVDITGATSANGKFAIRADVLTTEGGGEFTFDTKALVLGDSLLIRHQEDLDLGPIAQFVDATHFEVQIEDITQQSAPSPGETKGAEEKSDIERPAVAAQPGEVIELGYVHKKADGKKSLGASGHAVRFERPAKEHFVEAVEIFASRYGRPEPPDDEFHLYVLNGQRQVLTCVPYPYAMIERGDMRWYTLRTPSIEVPETFYIALAFNPDQFNGVYLGFDKGFGQPHSYVGLPGDGYQPVDEKYDWMVRVQMAERPSGEKGIYRLADWAPPVHADPFTGCLEAKYDDGESDGKRSYGGRGPAVHVDIADFLPSLDLTFRPKNLALQGLRIYGSRYGSGYDPETTLIAITVLDSANNVIANANVPYAHFTYKAKWVDIVFEEPIPLPTSGPNPDEFNIALNPEAQRTKGIYFHYDNAATTSHALVGTVEGGFEPLPELAWMIRAYFAHEDETE